MATLSPSAVAAVRTLVAELVACDFARIQADGRIGRLTEAELKRTIAEYGRTLVALPPDAMENIDVYLSETAPRQFSVNIPLWTAEEGRSDLTLSLTVLDADDRTTVSIDDLHVP